MLLSESKLKFEDNKMQLIVKAKNNNSEISKGYLCVRLFDKDNSELEQFTGQEVSLNGNKEGNYSGEKQIDNYKFELVASAKIYVGKFGCTNSPEEAISNIEIVDKNSISFSKVEVANNFSSANQIVDEYLENVDYIYFADGSCTPSEKKVCMTQEEYKKICSVVSDITLSAVQMKSYNASRDEKILLTGGTTEKIDFFWGKNYSGAEGCAAVITMSGIIDGNSKRLDIQGTAKKFIKNSNNKILVAYFE